MQGPMYDSVFFFLFFSKLEHVRVMFHFSSDQVTGENINSNATGYWARLVSPCVTSKTPWATVFGNHGMYIN